MTADINLASSYFNTHWDRYLNTLRHNTLYHAEMMQAMKQFLQQNYSETPFTFVDVGCGDAQSITPILKHFPVKKYTGIDEASEVLKLAAQNLDALACEKELIAENMITALPHLSGKADIIFSSYAVHHLSLAEKRNFIADCQQQLQPQGFLLLVDVIRTPEQTREEWLDILRARMAETQPEMTAEELRLRMEHPAKADFPEMISTFAEIAKNQSWQAFDVLVNHGIFAFMVFSK